MKTYAMILKNKVIGVVESNTSPIWPPDAQGNIVIAIECDNTVRTGMIYDVATGEFSQYVSAALPKKLTDTDILQAQLLLNQQELKIIQQSQDEVLAAILLSQQTL